MHPRPHPYVTPLVLMERVWAVGNETVILLLDRCVLCTVTIFFFQIREIVNLSHLGHLRVLNLAGNDISVLEGVSGLHSLSELNLRRNKITHVTTVLMTIFDDCWYGLF